MGRRHDDNCCSAEDGCVGDNAEAKMHFYNVELTLIKHNVGPGMFLRGLNRFDCWIVVLLNPNRLLQRRRPGHGNNIKPSVPKVKPQRVQSEDQGQQQVEPRPAIRIGLAARMAVASSKPGASSQREPGALERSRWPTCAIDASWCSLSVAKIKCSIWATPEECLEAVDSRFRSVEALITQ